MIEYVVLEMEFDCSEAIDGATAAAKKCPMMGPPWVIRRAQSDMIEYLVLEMEFEEEFRNMWSHFKESCKKKGEAQVDDTGGAKGSNGNKVHDKAGEGTGAADPHAETPEKKGC